MNKKYQFLILLISCVLICSCYLFTTDVEVTFKNNSQVSITNIRFNSSENITDNTNKLGEDLLPGDSISLKIPQALYDFRIVFSSGEVLNKSIDISGYDYYNLNIKISEIE